jgi:putative ABC transport system permease protein
MEIVGVVGDVKHFGLGNEVTPTIYQPVTQDCWREMSIVMRTGGEPVALARAAQEAIWRVDPYQPVTRVTPLAHLVRESISVQRFSALLLLGFSAIGLLLAGIGIYGVQAYLVTQRTQEIGLRLALGASVPGILRWVVGRGLRLTTVGLGLGLLAALAVSRMLGGLLHEMSALDPVTFTAVPLILGGVASLASWLPARRAAGVDPMIALRNE